MVSGQYRGVSSLVTSVWQPLVMVGWVRGGGTEILLGGGGGGGGGGPAREAAK